jgi:hypothetical protein
VFWINLPIGAVAIWLIAAFLDEQLQRREHQIDYLGSALLMLGLGAIMTVLVQGPSLTLPIAAALTGLGAGALAWLAVQERRAAEPVRLPRRGRRTRWARGVWRRSSAC